MASSEIDVFFVRLLPILLNRHGEKAVAEVCRGKVESKMWCNSMEACHQPVFVDVADTLPNDVPTVALSSFSGSLPCISRLKMGQSSSLSNEYYTLIATLLREVIAELIPL